MIPGLTVLMLIVAAAPAAEPSASDKAAGVVAAVQAYYDSLLAGRAVSWQVELRRCRFPAGSWTVLSVDGEDGSAVRRGARLCWITARNHTGEIRRLPATVNVSTVERLPVARTDIPARTVLSEEYVEWQILPATELGASEYPSERQLTELWAKVSIPKGAVLTMPKLAATPSVVIGSDVRLVSRSGLVEIVTLGKALEDGVLGERIRVQNNASGVRLKGFVEGKGLVRIE